MSYKQAVLSNNSNKIKQDQNVSVSEAYKDVSKYYKVVNFSLIGKERNGATQNKKKTTYIQPLRIIVLRLHTPEKCEKPYSVDVSCFFNKPSKSIVLKHLRQVKITKQLAHWIKPYGISNKRYMKGEFNNINTIVGSDISMHEYELYIDLRFQKIPLTKRHVSYIVAQTLCKTQYTNKSHQLSYTKDGGVIGALVLKNPHLKNEVSPIIGYYISDNELKQCASANFAKKQTVKVTEWASSAKSSNRTIPKFEHLLGDTSTSGELVRASIHAKLGGSLTGNLRAIVSLSTLITLKNPLYTLVNLLAKPRGC